jgi:16S rRNA (guanine527-N7)-methyltransferase
MVDDPAARALFGDRLGLADQYAELLVTDGVVRGLIGPREAPRIWDRHLLNCAAVAELIQPGARVVDVGSGAGLPGLALAIARPDLSVVLLEPLARRTSFLVEVVEALGLAGSVSVVRSRAEEAVGRLPAGPADVATARAVAPLDRLAGWCLPLVKVGGRLLAIKGASAAAEAAEHAAAVGRLGGGHPTVRVCGADLLDPATTVVELIRERVAVATGPAGRHRPTRSSTSDTSADRPRARRR